MNGTVRNWISHALVALAIQLLFGWLTGSLIYGGIVAVWGYWWREAGEFGAKHWDARNRPLSDFNPLHPARTHDDRMDLLFPVVAVLIPLIIERTL